MTKKPECIFDGADNKKDLKEEDNLFSVVAAKNYGRKMLILEQQQMCECCDARIVLTMPSRITSMIFVPMRGGIANAMRASGRFILLRTRTKAEHSFILLRPRTDAAIENNSWLKQVCSHVFCY